MIRTVAFVISSIAVALSVIPSCPVLSAQDKLDSSNRWEFKAVRISSDESNAANQLNALAAEGWEYVGPLPHDLVAFRRERASEDEILVEIVGRLPKKPFPGDKVPISVVVRSGNRELLSGATVIIAAGGGEFLTEDGQQIDPKDRGDHSNSVKGVTDSKGRFTTHWTARGGAYVLNVRVSKDGYITTRVDVPIRFIR